MNGVVIVLSVLVIVVGFCAALVYVLFFLPLPESYRADDTAHRVAVRQSKEERAAARRAHFEQLDRERTAAIEVGLSPTEALNRAIEEMTLYGHSLENRTENTVTFTRHQGADCAVGCALMLLFILPGLLYMFLYSSTRRLTLAAYLSDEIPGGSRLVIGGDDGMGIGILRDWARNLPTEAVVEDEQPTENEASTESSGIADKLRELTELKDSGLITETEFEAKKKDLLDRM